MSNSALATYTNISPNRTSPRNQKITRFSIHCTAFVGTAQKIADISRFQTKNALTGASCNYAIGYDGSIALVVPESDRSWCTSSKDNDHRAITFEVSSDNKEPYFTTDKAIESLISLIVDCCQRNGIKKVIWFSDKKVALNYQPKTGEAIFTVHRWFKNKACPGEYLMSKHQYICDSVNAILSAQNPHAGEKALFSVKVTVSSLNVRTKPSTKTGMIVSARAKNEIVPISEVSGTWGRITGKDYWMSISDKYVERI